MNCQELLDLADRENVDVLLHLPSGNFEGIGLIMVGGAITTKARYEVFDESLCHLDSDGDIYRYGQKIGTFEDIEIVNIIDGKFKEE